MFETPRKQLSAIGISSFIFLVGLLLILGYTDPYNSGGIVFFFMYTCLFLFLLNVFLLCIYFLRSKINTELHYQRLTVATRQGAFLTLFVVTSLVLSSHGILFWWIALSLALTLIFIEAFFLI